jgi:uncharacterized protein (TIGR03067 family)
MKWMLLICIAVLPKACFAEESERSRHAGKWAVLSMIRDDKEADPKIRASIIRVVEDDHIVWKRDDKSFAGTRFEFNLTVLPNEIDLIPDGGPATDKHVLGIYRFEAGQLTICIADAGQPRPKGFEAKVGSKQTLQTFKRIQP